MPRTDRLMRLKISIHALHEESDLIDVVSTPVLDDFNPRSP